jgi:hypothetical protein
VPKGSGTSFDTMPMADENGWPTRNERTISSTASGSCSSKSAMRFLALPLTQK